MENIKLDNSESSKSILEKAKQIAHEVYEAVTQNKTFKNTLFFVATVGTLLTFTGKADAQEKPGDMPVDDKTELAIGADEHKGAPGLDADSNRVYTEMHLDASNQSAEKVMPEEKGVEISQSYAAPRSYDSHRGVVDLDLRGAEEVTIQTFNEEGKPIEAKKFKGKADVFYNEGYSYRILDSKGNLLEKLNLNRDEVLAMDVQKKKMDIEQQKKNIEENLRQQINKIDQEKSN